MTTTPLREDQLPLWQALATEVSEVMRHPGDMGADPEFLDYARRKISQGEALGAFDEGGALLGALGFSRHYNRLTWFAVGTRHRRLGVGGALLARALAALDRSKPITVETHRAGYAPGEAARRFYHSHGFAETEPEFGEMAVQGVMVANSRFTLFPHAAV